MLQKIKNRIWSSLSYQKSQQQVNEISEIGIFKIYNGILFFHKRWTFANYCLAWPEFLARRDYKTLGYQFRFISSISNKRPWKRDSTDDLLDITAKTTMGQSWDQTGSPSPTGRTKGAPTRSYACPFLHMDPSFCTNHPSHSESAWRHPSSPALVSIIGGTDYPCIYCQALSTPCLLHLWWAPTRDRVLI